MKTLVIVLSFIALSASTPLKWRSVSTRRYLPEENDPFRIKHLWFEDEKGNLHYEDLTQPIPEVRASISDLTMHLYTRDNVHESVAFKIDNLDNLRETEPFDPKNPNYFIIHGWNNDYTSNVNIRLKKAILEKHDANIFVVDWSGPANKLYLTAFAAVPQLGGHVGSFINMIMKHYGLSPKMFRLIGHSLGAHVAGCAGAEVDGLVDYIVGLDPAGPLFTIGNIQNRLDETDAEFVHIIHTSDTLLGFGSAIGDADYFPNGGSGQPGCGLDIFGTCAHSRAYYYYEESILQGGFMANQCDSYKAYKKGECDNNDVSQLGTLDLDKRASGDYYLCTNKATPFALS